MSSVRLGALAAGLALAASPALAQGLAQCTIGQVVASPAGYRDKYLQSVVIAVTQGHPFPCRVHPLGYPPTMEESFKPAMLRAPGSVTTEPLGGVADDPHLLALKGEKGFKASAVVPGAYECWGAGSGGQLSARMALNFTIVDSSRYRDWRGNGGTYSFDAASGTILFQGAALNGQRGLYKQAIHPPIKKNPAQVFFQPSGDGCDWVSG